MSEIQNLVSDLKEIYAFLRQEDSQKYIGANFSINTFIKNAWGKISILNSKVEEKDMYLEFDNYFVKTTLQYLVDFLITYLIQL